MDGQVNGVQRVDLQDIRERTFKKVDAWWTVLLVDPLAVRLVWLVAPYRWITPNLLTWFATVLGVGAAVCFGLGDRGWLIAGALLFHASFVVDCMDGKIARLRGIGTLFGAWFDFMFDRLRIVACSAALFGGQYYRTGNSLYFWLAFGVITADLFRYLNGSQMAKMRRLMRSQLAEARGEAVETGPENVSPEEAADDTPPPAATAASSGRRRSTYVRARDWLQARRIRIHLVSGIEFEMFVFIVGPLTGWVIGTTIVASVLLLMMEAALVGRMWLASRKFTAQMAGLERSAAPLVEEAGEPVIPRLTPLRG
jgi:phosphatidylglycerophosphate synthase